MVHISPFIITSAILAMTSNTAAAAPTVRKSNELEARDIKLFSRGNTMCCGAGSTQNRRIDHTGPGSHQELEFRTHRPAAIHPDPHTSRDPFPQSHPVRTIRRTTRSANLTTLVNHPFVYAYFRHVETESIHAHRDQPAVGAGGAPFGALSRTSSEHSPTSSEHSPTSSEHSPPRLPSSQRPSPNSRQEHNPEVDWSRKEVEPSSPGSRSQSSDGSFSGLNWLPPTT